jgi:hypothetical protein
MLKDKFLAGKEQFIDGANKYYITRYIIKYFGRNFGI